MAKTIDRDTRIKQIQTQIEECKAYLKLDPDPSVTERLNNLEKNPCLEGMYYLNAIYKDIQYERSTEVAKKYKETIWLNIPYYTSDYTINGYIVRMQGFWQKEILEGPFLSIGQLEMKANELKNQGLVANTDFIEYIDINPIMVKIRRKYFK